MTAVSTRAELVAAYLSRLGYGGDPPPPTLETLVDLHARHLATFPYENLEIMLGRPPSVEPRAVLRRVGSVGRAGYCFHHNGAIEAVLAELGFAVARRAGHVWSAESERDAWSLNHLVLVVSGLATGANPAGDWWVDVGLGDAFVSPVPLVPGPCGQSGFHYEVTEVTAGGWSFRADPSGSFAGVDVRPGPTAAEVAASHAQLSTPPGRFTRVLVVQRRDDSGVDVVRGCLRQRVTASGRTEEELTTYDQWRGAIADGCGLSLAGVEDEELGALWGRSLEAHRSWTEAGRP